MLYLYNIIKCYTVLLEYFAGEKTFANEPNQQKNLLFATNYCILAEISTDLCLAILFLRIDQP